MPDALATVALDAREFSLPFSPRASGPTIPTGTTVSRKGGRAGPGRVLLLAIENGRWGPARLPRELGAAGLSVAVLAPAGNPLLETRFAPHRFVLPRTRSARRMATSLASVLAAFHPDLLIPTDEQVVALLHHLVRRGATARFPAALLDIVKRSLGPVETFDATMMKSETQRLARRLGVRVPPGGTVDSLPAATAMAARIGYPLYLKVSFSWAGQGAVLCHDEAELKAAMQRASARAGPVKAWLRRRLDRAWYATGTELDLQAAIPGTAAMYNAFAWQGRMLAGFAAVRRASPGGEGPSTVVELCAQREMAQAAAVLVDAMGATGFICFDFVIEEGTGRAFLLECNPRPNQVFHLGARVGVDLCGAMAAALRGDLGVGPWDANRSALVPLFPQLWKDDAATASQAGCEMDVPWDDPSLLAHMVKVSAAGAAATLAAHRVVAVEQRAACGI